MKRPVLAFYLAAFGITWLLQLPAALASLGVIPGPFERYLLFSGFGALGPLLAAVIVSRVEGGRAGVRALFRPLRAWRVHPVWYLVALGTSGALFAGSMALYALVAGRDVGPWFYPPRDAPALAALVFFPLGEEVGWRGFALPRLQSAYGPVVASVIVGALWCAWHAMMFITVGTPLLILAQMLPFFIGGSLVFTWIYNRTGGSLLLAVLAHVGTHLNNSNKTLPAGFMPVALHSVAFCAMALVLLLVDRRAWPRRDGA